MTPVCNEKTFERTTVNKVKGTLTFQNKLVVDKGKPKPENIHTFLGLFNRKNRSKIKTRRPELGIHLLSKRESLMSTYKKGQLMNKSGDLGSTKRITREKLQTGLLKRGITLKESQKYDSTKLIKLLQQVE